MSKPAVEEFNGIYLDLSKQPGKVKFAEAGLAWRPSAGGENFGLDGQQFTQCQWSRGARGYEVKILLRDSGVIQLDGFDGEVSLLHADMERWGSDIFRNTSACRRFLSCFTVSILNTRIML